MEGLKKYPKLLSPVKVGNHVFKNRLIAGMGGPYNLQGPEEFVSQSLMQSYISKAKNGAGMVCIDNFLQRPYGRHIETNEEVLRNRLENPNPFNRDHGQHGGSGRMDFINIVNGGCQNHLSELAESIHFYGAKTVFGFQIMQSYPGYGVSDKPAGSSVHRQKWKWEPDWAEKEIPRDMMDKFVEEVVLMCTLVRECGFDGIYLHMNYRESFIGQFLSPMTNRRTDEFGGSVENRARFPIMIMDAIKKRCGKDFLIFGSINSHDLEGSYTFDDTLRFARLFSGHMDILQVKSGRTLDESAPLGFERQRIPALRDSARIREAAPDLPIAVNGGFEYPEECEEAIVNGQTDFVSLTRAWIANPDYGIKVYEGRSEDIVPCLRCNGCHLSSYSKPWVSVCAVNPQWGLEHNIEYMTKRLTSDKKKVAVIGGGVAGMEAALTASENGHDVTLYEKEKELGGTLRRIAHISYKWPHKEFMDYMIRQVEKSCVRVILNTNVTRDLLVNEGYEVIVSSIGSSPQVPPVPGVHGDNVYTGVEILGQEDVVKGDTVIIGGGEVGVDIGLHLAECGHKVTVIEMTDMLARTAVPIHYYDVLMEQCEHEPNFNFVLNASCSGIFADKVTYNDADGKEHEVKADTVVLCCGMKAKHDEAMKFNIEGTQMIFVGDCSKAGDIQHAMRSAFGAASQI